MSCWHQRHSQVDLKKKKDILLHQACFLCADEPVPHLPPPSAGQHSSTLAVQQRGMAQPRLTLPISAQALVSHGPHPTSLYCFRFPSRVCHI